MVSKDRKIKILKNKIEFCEKNKKHLRIKEKLKKELDRLINS